MVYLVAVDVVRQLLMLDGQPFPHPVLESEPDLNAALLHGDRLASAAVAASN